LRGRLPQLRTFTDRLAALPPFAWARERFPRQVAWIRSRVEPGSPTGFTLTFWVSAGALAAWAFGGLTQDVVGHDEVALLDPRAERFVLAHRAGWLTAAMKDVTWLGSTVVIVPLLVMIGGYFVIRRRDWRPGARLSAAVVGAVVLYDVVKLAVDRPRPPMTFWIGHFAGGAFPSGHATQTVAFYGMLAAVTSAGRRPKVQARLWGGAALIALVVGSSRVYLGAHWLSDVLGGWALGVAWLATVLVASLLVQGGRKPARTTIDDDQPPPAFTLPPRGTGAGSGTRPRQRPGRSPPSSARSFASRRRA